ncbi:MAG TPA: hypothetical protein VFG94_13990, partial [Acidimicrobiales bacterium]|nr:hypothetical protein [Acidimicrobiales bacterium]
MNHVIDPHPRRPTAADADGLREACGVFGVYARGSLTVARLTYLGLFALQHRGQEAAGMAVSDGDTLTVVKDQGLVASVFDDRTLAGLTGHLAIGHCRYSTTGSSTWRNAQPAYRSVGENMFALGHNGNLVNTEKLAADAGMLEGTVTSDSDLVAELIAAELTIDLEVEELAGLGAPVPRAAEDGPRGRLERAVVNVVPRLEGAFSLVIMDEARVIGVRDPHGFRPLCLGRLDTRDTDHSGWVLASETPALDIVGATFVRELEPGEMVVIDDAGVRSLHPYGPT